MNSILRIAAVVGGLLAGGSIVMIIQWISSLIYVIPPELDRNNYEEMSTWIGALPAGAFLFVLLSEALGYLVSTFVARRLAPARSAIPALIVWGFLFLAAIVNLFTIPHPPWFAPASIISCLVFGLSGLVLAAPASYSVTCTRTINAPIEKVFKTLATIEEFSKAVPGIEKVEFLTDSHYGVGTRFRETRIMNGKEAATELEVTELVENRHFRLVSDAGGTIWDTVFRVQEKGKSVEMNMQMDARPHRVFARIITPMILGMVSKFVEQDMDSIKAFCEQSSP